MLSIYLPDMCIYIYTYNYVYKDPIALIEYLTLRGRGVLNNIGEDRCSSGFMLASRSNACTHNMYFFVALGFNLSHGHEGSITIFYNI